MSLWGLTCAVRGTDDGDDDDGGGGGVTRVPLESWLGGCGLLGNRMKLVWWDE